VSEETGIIEESDREYTPEEMMALIDETMPSFDDGDIVTGTIVRVERDEVLVDIGYKSEGVIPVRELSIRKDVNPEDVVSIGDEIEALVLQKEDKDGRLVLSKKRAEYERAWLRIEEKFNSGENVEGEVIEVVKGGLILDIGLRGFLPASLVDLRRVKDLNSFLGEKLEARVIEMDRNRNNVVLSRRVVLEEGRRHERQAILTKLVKGQILPGAVSSIVDFGAFVDLGGIDGLVHISELSWSHVNHPSEVVKVGDEVQVQVLDVDMDRERISLGLKQTQEDPWKSLVKAYAVGSIQQGRVTKLVPFGAFIALGDGVEGLVHISEMSREHVEKPEDLLSVGDEVTVKVMDIDLERRRISLSIKAAAEELGLEPPAPRKPEPIVSPEELAAEDAGGESADEAAAEETEVPETGESAEDAAEESTEDAVEEAEEAATEEATEASADDTAAEESTEDAVEEAEEAIAEAVVAEEVAELAEEVAVVETVEALEAAEVAEEAREAADEALAEAVEAEEIAEAAEEIAAEEAIEAIEAVAVAEVAEDIAEEAAEEAAEEVEEAEEPAAEEAVAEEAAEEPEEAEVTAEGDVEVTDASGKE
jgi:small subunit ribosomal protein S1